MRFVLMPPSLEHRALVKMAVSLWNQDDVWALIAEFDFEDGESSDDEWKEIEERVRGKVLRLPLPQPLKGKVSGCIRPIGAQIFNWIDFHCSRYDLPLSLAFKLCWTPQGTVDRKRTAEVLVKDERLDIFIRYTLACICCFEDDIMALWNTLSEDLKQSFLLENSPDISLRENKWIIDFWSRTMKERELGRVPTSYKGVFQLFARNGQKAAIEYFLQKLTPREREECLVKSAEDVGDAEVLCFLLSEMNEEQQMEVFKKDPVRVLGCFLQWPWQSFFMETANCMWDFLSKNNYDWLLINIVDEVADGHTDWNYQKLFREFWQKSPHAQKSFIANNLDKSQLLIYLFYVKDKEIIRLILEDATLAAREKLIYSDKMHHYFQECILCDKWDSVEIFIRECFPSKDLMLKFKEAVEKSDGVEDILVENKDKWDRLFLSSDDSLREYEKSAEEGESRSFKRFRSLE